MFPRPQTEGKRKKKERLCLFAFFMATEDAESPKHRVWVIDTGREGEKGRSVPTFHQGLFFLRGRTSRKLAAGKGKGDRRRPDLRPEDQRKIFVLPLGIGLCGSRALGGEARKRKKRKRSRPGWKKHKKLPAYLQC